MPMCLQAFQCLETLHSLEGGIRGLRRLFSAGAEANDEEAVVRKVNMLVDKVCERVDKADLAHTFKIGERIFLRRLGCRRKTHRKLTCRLLTLNGR